MTSADTRAAGALMPDWLIQVVVQYPIVAIVGLVAWYAHRKVERANAEAREHDRQGQADAVAVMKASYERLAETQAAEITRLNEEFREELGKLVKVVTELNRRLIS